MHQHIHIQMVLHAFDVTAIQDFLCPVPCNIIYSLEVPWLSDYPCLEFLRENSIIQPSLNSEEIQESSYSGSRIIHHLDLDVGHVLGRQFIPGFNQLLTCEA